MNNKINKLKSFFLKKKIFIAVSRLHKNDSVSNCVIAQYNIFSAAGFRTRVLTDGIDNELVNTESIQFDNSPAAGDMIILHYAGMNDFTHKILNTDSKIIVYYHNVTPSEFYRNYSKEIYDYLNNDDDAFSRFRDKITNIVSVSEFSRVKLLALGFRSVDVIPILLDYTKYENFNKNLYLSLQPEKINYLIFTGKIFPHKNQLELIKILGLYREKYKAHNIKLLLVGSITDEGRDYYIECVEYIKKNGLSEFVIFTGDVSDECRNAYYKCAKIFVSASLHEGFGIPLVEAIYFKLPVIAYSKAAIAETLSGYGELLLSENIETFADKIFMLMKNKNISDELTIQRNQVLNKYKFDAVKKFWLDYSDIFFKINKL